MRATRQLQQHADTAALAQTPDSADFSNATPEQHWLNVQCNMLQDIHCGMLFRIAAEFTQAQLDASWPRLVATRKGLVRKVLICARRDKAFLEEVPAEDGAAPTLRLYQPIAVAGGMVVVMLEMADRSRSERRTVANLLRWNSEWLKYALASGPQPGQQDLVSMFAMAIAALDQGQFRGTATALITEIAGRFGCQRVSLGLRKGRRIEVQVLSHSARFKHETNLIQAIGAAMDEAADQDRTILYPHTDAGQGTITHAHAQLARQLHSGSVCSIPISEGGDIIGAVTLERESGPALDEFAVQRIEQVMAVVAPALWLKYLDEQGLHRKAWRSLKAVSKKLFGPAHIKLKLTVLAALALVAFFSVAQGDWRVTADAVVEGSVQRTIAAPIDGYIASAEARAGDVVKAGEQIGALDDSDLRLQRLKWSTLRQQMISESREARAQNSRSEVSIITAKIEQADAELELVDEQLARTRLLAPFDGVVIEGDLSQLLGTPVRRGDVLFKVAPLDDYRIVLNVDEQDIAAVSVGQKGRLVLASLPGKTLELEVSKVTPVSTATGGRNFFRVEARLLGENPPLQPGMEGVGKVAIGEANLFWIWTHELANWLRLQFWTWWR